MILRVATVPARLPARRSRTWEIWWVMPTPPAKRMQVPYECKESYPP